MQNQLEIIKTKLPNTPVTTCEGNKHAGIALMLRVNEADEIEVLFILRATNPKDRWSGQVGLPGGKQEPNETIEEAVIREVKEEIGIDVETYFDKIGRVHDRAFTHASNTLVVTCFVYLQRKKNKPDLSQYTLDGNELAAIGWCPLNLFLTDCGTRYRHDMKNIPLGKKKAGLFVLNALGLSHGVFTKIDLTISEIVVAKEYEDEANIKNRFLLWGMTLGVLNDFLVDFTGLRKDRIMVREQPLCCFPKVEILNNYAIHNIGMHYFGNYVLHCILRRKPHWRELVQWYSVSVVGTILVTVITGGILLSKL